jgi:exodeoxyribonuclease-5
MFAEVTGVHSSEPVNYAVELDVRTELESDLTKLQVLSATFEDLHKFDIPYHRLRELQQFDYGYCITVHKSQGSQFDKVVLVDDKFLSWDRTNRTRWLYTAVTRAVDSIIVI